MTPTLAERLKLNGVIMERARLDGRSLSKLERAVILAARQEAANKGFERHRVNELEMLGERDKEAVFEPVNVQAKFAYYEYGYEEIPPSASYEVTASNFIEVAIGSNVSAETLSKVGAKIPKTPSYEEWLSRRAA